MAVVRYEQRRITSIRSTWIIIVLTLVLAGLFAAGTAAIGNVDLATGNRVGVAPLTNVLATLINPIVLVPLSVLAAMAFGGEYRFGLIRLTLTTFPQRTKVFFAKLWVVVLWMLLTLIVTLALVLLISWLYRNNINFNPLEIANVTYVLRGLLYALGYCLFTFALVLITRNQALSIVVVILWTLLVEQLLVGFLGSRFEWLPKALPMSSGAGFVTGDDMLRNGLVFLGFLVVFLAAGWALFSRRDA